MVSSFNVPKHKKTYGVQWSPRSILRLDKVCRTSAAATVSLAGSARPHRSDHVGKLADIAIKHGPVESSYEFFPVNMVTFPKLCKRLPEENRRPSIQSVEFCLWSLNLLESRSLVSWWLPFGNHWQKKKQSALTAFANQGICHYLGIAPWFPVQPEPCREGQEGE